MTVSALDQIEWSKGLEFPRVPVPQALVQRAERLLGFWPSQLDAFASCPWLIEAFLDTSEMQFAHVSPKLVDLIHLVVSQDNSCRYCYGLYRTFLKLKGYSEAQIQKLETDLQIAELVPEERLALDFCRRLSRANPRPGSSEIAALREAGYTPEAIVEVALATCLTAMENRLATFAALQPSGIERLTDSWYGPVLRPLYVWNAKRKYRLIPAPTLAPPPSGGPGTGIISALRDVPGTTNLRRIVQHLWTSPLLPIRTKGMIIAVIGHALGCPVSRREVENVLSAEGISREDLDEILSRLTSGKLDAVETRLVPVARETVRYQNTRIQERIRTLTQEIKPEQVLDAVGVFSVANAMCRLTAVLDQGS